MQICTSLQTDNHASTSLLSFLQAGRPSCRPTNSVKALKAKTVIGNELEFGVIVKINVDVKRLAVTTAFWSEEVLVKRSVHAHRCTYAQP